MLKNLTTFAVWVALVCCAQAELVISQQPVSIMRYAGGTAQFTVQATGDTPLVYQWLANGSNLFDSGNISGSTNATLTISGVSTTSTGSYQVVVTNISGAATSSVAMLSLALPFSTNAVTYENAILQAGPVAYWRLNELGDPSSGDLIARDYWAGFDGLYGAASGVGVTGPIPSNGFNIFEPSNTAVLFAANTANSDVVIPPLNLNTNTVTFTCWMNPSTAGQAGYAGVIFCRTATTVSGLCYNNFGSQLGFTWNNANASDQWQSGLTPPANQWSFVALVITPTNATLYVDNTNGQTSASLAIGNASQAFDGPIYFGTDPYTSAREFGGALDEVAIFNYAMTPAQVAQLYQGAKYGPIITSQPVSQTVFPTRSVQFSVGASGNSALTYQWQSNGVNLVDDGNLTGSATATLAINSVSTANVGSYQVVVTNISGAVMSSVASLTLIPISGDSEGTILAANPVAYWRLNELGNPADGDLIAYDYWGGNNGVYGSAVILEAPGPQPGPNYSGFDIPTSAMQLTPDEFDSYATMPPLNLDTNTVTIGCWIKPNAGAQNSSAALVFCRGGTTTAGLNFDNTGTYLGYTWNNEAGTYNWISGLSSPADQWSYVVLAVSPTNAILSLCTTSGEQSATNVYTHVNQNFDGDTWIGNDPANYPRRTFGGVIADVAIFNYALSPAQVSPLPDMTYSPSATINLPAGTFYAGDPFSFIVTAQGSPPFSYQWFLNSTAIAQATNASLSFAALTTNDSGFYTLQISNSAGMTTSPPTFLNVNIPPVALNSLAAAVENQTATISVASLLAKDYNPAGNGLAVVSVTGGTNGASVLLERDEILYTPPLNFVGADCFTYTVSDTNGRVATGNIKVSVVPTEAMYANPVKAPCVTPDGMFRADFLGIPYTTYAIETAPCVNGPWTLLTNLTAGTNGLFTLKTCVATNPALFFSLPGGGPSGQLALAQGEFPQLSAGQGNVILDTNSIQDSLNLYFPALGTNIPLVSPTVLCSNTRKLVLQYSAVGPGGGPIQVTRTLCLSAQLQKTVLMETMTLTGTNSWTNDFEIQRPFTWQAYGGTVQAYVPMSDGSCQQTDLTQYSNQWQYPLGYTPDIATQTALPVTTFASGTARCSLVADPYYGSLVEVSLTNGNVEGQIRYTYQTSVVPLSGHETRQFCFVLATNAGFPTAFEDGVNDFYAQMLPDVPPGPDWLKQIAMCDYDFMSDGGVGWTNDITHLAGCMTPDQRARTVFCLHGWYDGLGSYAFDTNNDSMETNWLAIEATERIPMSIDNIRYRLQFAKTNGFRVLLYFGDGLLDDSGAPWYRPDWTYQNLEDQTVNGWLGADTFWTTYAMNPAHPDVIGFYTNYLNALLATYGDLADGFVWDETFYMRQGFVTTNPAPAYCDVAFMKLIKGMRQQVKNYNPQMVFLASDARGYVADDVPGYAMLTDGTWEDISGFGSLFSYGLYCNWRNTLWSCNWYPVSGFYNSQYWVQNFGAPVPSSDGQGESLGPSQWTPAEQSEIMALFSQRLALPPTTGYFVH